MRLKKQKNDCNKRPQGSKGPKVSKDFLCHICNTNGIIRWRKKLITVKVRKIQKKV